MPKKKMLMKLKKTKESSKGSITMKNNMTPEYRTTGTVVKRIQGNKVEKRFGNINLFK